MVKWLALIDQLTRLFPDGEIDSLGNTREDLASMLWLHMREKLGGREVSRAYVFTLLRNKLVDYQRQLTCEINMVPTNGLVEETSDLTPEQEAINKDALLAVYRILPAYEWDILMGYVHYSSIKEAWEEAGKPVSYEVFRRQIHGAMTRCCEIINNLEDFREINTKMH